MTSLIFRALDKQVVGGLADHPAIDDEHGAMSYAQLLHESASIAGALSQLGVVTGTEVHIDLPAGREQVVAVLACARLGAVPTDGAAFHVTPEPLVVRTPDTEVPWDVLLRAGRTDPAGAPDSDPDGYEVLMRDAFGGVFVTLESGGTLT